jgi:signal transduction histidine kinase/CheY-like chemotaxis protein/methyl-accepting chemotaxis protein
MCIFNKFSNRIKIPKRMLRFNNLGIRNKLRTLSLISIICLVILGYFSNYFFNTSKVLGIIINAERVHNNTFQEGVEYFYKYQIQKDKRLLDSATVRISKANQMAYQFSIIDQSLKRPEKEYIDILLKHYLEAYYYDPSMAYLMASRIKLFTLLNSDKLKEAMKITHEGYILGEKVKQEIIDYQNDSSISTVLEQDLVKIRQFYTDFSKAIAALNEFANYLLNIAIILFVLFIISFLAIISGLISQTIVVPIQEMVDKFKVIARGNLDTQISVDNDNEIGNLAQSFREIQVGLKKVIEYTKEVAQGDYSTPIVPRSDEDELSIALNKMVDKLRESYNQTEQDSWFKSGINLLNEKLRGDQKISDISSHTLSFLSQFLHSQIGSIYLYNEDTKTLKILNSIGLDIKKVQDKFKLAEGIIGQAAQEKKIISLNELTDKTYVSYSSSGEYIPKQIIVVPMVFNDSLIGVLELGSLKMYSDLELQFISQATDIVAINLNSAVNILKTNELLQKTQVQASELQVQQEELRVANEELVEHTNVLTENEKRLQVQQEELRVANEELEERTRQLEIQKDDISKKNSELTEIKEKLELKARELQLASQYKSEFLANMSHELRTPLNSLLILSNLLSNNKKGNLTAEQVQSAKIIQKSGTDLLYLINEVLDLSKIEAGKMNLEISNVPTTEIKEEIVMNFKATAEEKKLAFQVNISDDFPKILLTDRYRLMQIIRNLLSNAFKFTSAGRVTVEMIPTPNFIRFNNTNLSPQKTCCIKVTDTGVGIPAEKLELIFEAFQQADGSISRKYGGTGLGLSISRELIKMLGGEIQLESFVNKGSSFYIYLPLKTDEHDKISEVQKSAQLLTDEQKAVNQKEANEEKALPIPANFIEDDRNLTPSDKDAFVLIIHPNKNQAEKFCQQAKAKHYKILAASTISDGILLAQAFHPKAIMLALELAKTENTDYQKLSAHPEINKLPVHLISPIEYENTHNQEKLNTLESESFIEALNSLENKLIGNSRRILIVEDDIGTRQIINNLLSELNIEIKEVTLAEEAYQLLTSEVFDCIILDLGLPDYSGKDLLAKLKNNQITIPKVIVYTGKEMSKEDIKSLNMYTSTIILKGLKSDERLMDEVSLFLHQVSQSIPTSKPKSKIADDENLFKGKKILIVDDEIRNVFALGKILEDKDIEVFEAENGQVAIDMLTENKNIDLILMDVMMPVMNGYEAMEKIRQIPDIKHIPIICLTAKAMKEDHINALKHGANDYLAKPINEEKLFAMLKIWFYKK